MHRVIGNEADVESLIAEPLLVDTRYLGFPKSALRPKRFIAPYDIDKGNKKIKGYFPDYIVELHNLPAIALEAKKPNENALEAFREAQLYCQAVNTNFSAGVNPCKFAIGLNSKEIYVGTWDASPKLFKWDDLSPQSSSLDDLRSIISSDRIYSELQEIQDQLVLKSFKRASSFGDGETYALSRVGLNDFATEIAPALRDYFTSENQNNNREIFETAYVSSAESSGYDRQLDFYLRDRVSKRDGITVMKPTKRDEKSMSDRIKNFGNSKKSEGELQILTGGVGAGKSLFIRRYKELLLPEEIKDRVHWAFLDFNTAPPETPDWKEWIYSQISGELNNGTDQFDILDGDDQERILNQKIKERSAYYKRMEGIEGQSAALEKARDIEQWRADPEILTKSLIRFLQGDKRHTVVIVFDNVDRRSTDEQLLAFQWAMNIKQQTRALIILQMRDITFERFKDEPPLDTFKTGGVFHISPPNFVTVVRKRLELALQNLHGSVRETQSFVTDGGATLTFPATDAANFLREIYTTIFDRSNNTARIIDSLAVRNVRRSLDMFMSILTSGHIPSSLMGSLAMGGTKDRLPEYIILRTLMRGDYRFARDDTGFTANIFHTHESWGTPSNLIIPNVLYYLVAKRKVTGDNGQSGYIAVSRLQKLLSTCGFSEHATLLACNYILKNSLAEADSFTDDGVRPASCLRISSSGYAHMRYLSSRSEYILGVLPFTPVNDSKLQHKIYDSMRIETLHGSTTYQRRKQLLLDFQVYIRNQIQHFAQYPGAERLSLSGSTYILSQVTRAMDIMQNFDKERLAVNQLDLL